MLANNIDVDAACKIGEGHTQRMGGDGIYHSFAMQTLIETHLFFICRSLANSAGLIRFFPNNVEC